MYGVLFLSMIKKQLKLIVVYTGRYLTKMYKLSIFKNLQPDVPLNVCGHDETFQQRN